LPTGEKAADRRKSCRLEKLLTGQNSFASRQLFRRSAAILPAGEFSSVGSVFASRQLFRRPAAFFGSRQRFWQPAAFLPASEFFAGQQFCQSAAFASPQRFCRPASFSPVNSFASRQLFRRPASFLPVNSFAGQRVFRRSTVLPVGSFFAGQRVFRWSTVLPVGSLFAGRRVFCRSTVLPVGSFFAGRGDLKTKPSIPREINHFVRDRISILIQLNGNRNRCSADTSSRSIHCHIQPLDRRFLHSDVRHTRLTRAVPSIETLGSPPAHSSSISSGMNGQSPSSPIPDGYKLPCQCKQDY
jgi:hypothetical protein